MSKELGAFIAAGLLITLAGTFAVIGGLVAPRSSRELVERGRVESEGPCPRPRILQMGEWDHCAAKTDPWKCNAQTDAWNQMLECARKHPIPVEMLQ